MKIYGVALLAICYLLGKIIGTAIGQTIGIDGDVGGVGFGMLFLMFAQYYFNKQSWFNQETLSGITFWSAIYIPIVIANAASSNVSGALAGGIQVTIIGVIVTVTSFFLIPLIAKIGK